MTSRHDGSGPSFEGPDASESELELHAEVPADVADAAEAVLGESLLSETILGDVLAERDGYLASLQRLQADFENYRKRTERQQREFAERATESLLERLLPVLDALDLAVAHVAPGEDGDPTAVVRPFLQIASLLRDNLAKEGLEAVAAVDVDFDPTVHDAVAHEPAEAGDEGAVVVAVLRPGYRLKGRVLRPAMVKVRG